MAAAVVGGAFLSAFFDVVLDRLASPQVANLIRGKKLDPKLLQRLETTLTVVGAVLNDAEKKQITDSKVNKWLDDLKDAVYVADDLLDKVSTKAATQKKVRNLFSRLFNAQDRKMVNMLEGIVERLESILKHKKSLDLKENAMENLSVRHPSTSLLDDGSRTYGRDKDKEAIIKLLLDDNIAVEQVSVIPIVGMGGVGKTTLAQLVYNDENLKQKFDFTAWVCVSEEFDILRVTKAIIEAIGKTREMNDLNLLQQDLLDKLNGKKLLIVLDDVWMEEYDIWNLLKKPFQRGIRGSKILVTTRSRKVASIVQTVQTYQLDELSEADCWLVFANNACFSSTSSRNVMAMEKIGRKIARKCKGLPLAARSLGGILRNNHDIKDWNNILNSDTWELPENLLPTSNKGKTLEEVGSEYFDYLVSRSFLQRTYDSFVMHDLMHDLGTFLGGDFYFRSEGLGKETKISSKTRHWSFSRLKGPILGNIEVFDKVKFLRTFLPIECYFASFNSKTLASDLLLKLKYLRVLSFRDLGNLNALPHSIGELIHLRYLDLSMTGIMALPESLCKLYNLQTLKLFGCVELTMLPSDMQNLVNLRHLDIGDDDDQTYFEEMPKGMSKLNQLQHLPYFIVGRHKENGIKELGGLSNLHGSLEILSLENVTNSSEALEARIMDKKHINNLSLKWTSYDYDCPDSQIEFDILCKLQPHQDLQELSISGYNRGTRFPDWVGNSSYNNMTDLRLSDCNNCWKLPSLGQLPSLKSLSISKFYVLETVDVGFYKNDDSSHVKPFPSLEYLRFEDMACWEVWSSFESDAFSQLKHLTISECPRLRGALPNHLPALETLKIEHCEQLASSLPRFPAILDLEIYKSNKVALQELPHSIRLLTIDGNPLVVESVIEAINNSQLTCLHFLQVEDCSSEISFPWNRLPTSLETLRIYNCDNLTSLQLESFPNLKNLVISECENLESLSMPQSLHNLREFTISKSLPRQMNTLISKLQNLRIHNCPEIVWFPEGGMLPNLRYITIENCEKLLSGQAWPSMDMLTKVKIIGPCDGIKSFPKEGLLPASLKNLELDWFSSLETLNCKGLLHLTSLRNLAIRDCWELENLAGESLPASLTKLNIYRCPLLQERCRMKQPQIWPKISHITTFELDFFVS